MRQQGLWPAILAPQIHVTHYRVSIVPDGNEGLSRIGDPQLPPGRQRDEVPRRIDCPAGEKECFGQKGKRKERLRNDRCVHTVTVSLCHRDPVLCSLSKMDERSKDIEKGELVCRNWDVYSNHCYSSRLYDPPS